MGRKSSGLRNRNRAGTGPYSAYAKSRSKDSYGEYQNGRCVVRDNIAGHTLDATRQDGRDNG